MFNFESQSHPIESVSNQTKSECVYDGQCTQLNKGICNIETKKCICNIGYFENGSSCGGGFSFVNFHFWLTEIIFTLIQFPHRMPRGSSLQWS